MAGNKKKRQEEADGGELGAGRRWVRGASIQSSMEHRLRIW
eukprot:CAMPEP_0171064762 /NCGR_PEP_ID=MMETSP0766_2-20121228/6481_1 /TAXON_ID=439317 /ORGANISM="Gambierdiscus australes, Strain CAWD 149" /LENGTH=40 /DNA_ID= /DNA_START= /DNA_END= /DNA_ORIENTATION=